MQHWHGQCLTQLQWFTASGAVPKRVPLGSNGMKAAGAMAPAHTGHAVMGLQARCLHRATMEPRTTQAAGRRNHRGWRISQQDIVARLMSKVDCTDTPPSGMGPAGEGCGWHAVMGLQARCLDRTTMGPRAIPAAKHRSHRGGRISQQDIVARRMPKADCTDTPHTGEGPARGGCGNERDSKGRVTREAAGSFTERGKTARGKGPDNGSDVQRTVNDPDQASRLPTSTSNQESNKHLPQYRIPEERPQKHSMRTHTSKLPKLDTGVLGSGKHTGAGCTSHIVGWNAQTRRKPLAHSGRSMRRKDRARTIGSDTQASTFTSQRGKKNTSWQQQKRKRGRAGSPRPIGGWRGQRDPKGRKEQDSRSTGHGCRGRDAAEGDGETRRRKEPLYSTRRQVL